MTDNASSHLVNQYHYVLSSDGCDETFDVYLGHEYLASFPFWDKKAEAEALAKRLVELLSAAKPVRR